jgi:hypothetical protein
MQLAKIFKLLKVLSPPGYLLSKSEKVIKHVDNLNNMGSLFDPVLNHFKKTFREMGLYGIFRRRRINS